MLPHWASYDKKVLARQVIPLAPGYRTALSSCPAEWSPIGCKFASMAIPVGKWVGFVRFNFFFSFLFLSVSVKVLPVTPLVSGVFVHRAFCAYFLRIERVVEMHRFLWWTQQNN